MRTCALVLLALGCALPCGCTATPTATSAGAPAGQIATIVPDSPRMRAWDNPLGDAGGHGGQVYLQIAGQRLGVRSNRFEVPAGRVEMQAIFQDHQTPVTARMLQTKAVTIAFDAQAGRTYRVRGVAFYPPADSPLRRTADTTKYRVVFAVQDADTGQVVTRVDVPPERNELVDPETGEAPW